MQANTREINLTCTALHVLEKRYLRKDAWGKVIETPEQMFHRVAAFVASAETIYDPAADVKAKEGEFYHLMASLNFLPNSPTLLNAAIEPGQLSACFALPVEDSLEGVFETVKDTAIIHKSGGGTGYSFSRLRPAGDRVGDTAGVAGGPVAFISVISAASDAIKQGGIRRGCSIGVLNVHHPDVMEYIMAKDDPMALTNFCISIALTDEFMEALENDTGYNLINPRNKEVVGNLRAKDVFARIVEQSWKTGDPGVIFIDRINRANPTPKLGKIETVTGCAEQALLPYESCNLGSINLGLMLKDNAGKAKVDYDKLARTVKSAVNFLDNVIDVNSYPLPQVEELTKKTRKMGLGVIGYADMLFRLGIPYDSEEALKVAADVMGFINDESHKTSEQLAIERGVFPAFDGSIYDVPGGPRRRNASCTTVAPTGTISLIAGCCNGIEPYFAMVFVRNILDGEHLLEVNPIFEEVARKEGFYSAELLRQLVSCRHLDEIESIPDEFKRVFVTTNQIDPQWHVRTQGTFQKYTDGAVSKMVNLPASATRQDIADVFLLAYKEGLKGVTNYRDTSRQLQSLCTDEVALELVNKYISGSC